MMASVFGVNEEGDDSTQFVFSSQCSGVGVLR